MCYLVSLPFKINNKKNFNFMNKVWLRIKIVQNVIYIKKMIKQKKKVLGLS